MKDKWFLQPTPYTRPDRVQLILWVLCMLSSLVIMINNLPKYQVGVTIDDATYLILARSLVYANQYGLINYPDFLPPTQFPFGFPLLLAPIAAVFPTQLTIYKFLSLITILLNASLVFWGWRLLTRNLSYWWALAVANLYLFSLISIDLSGRVMSEPVFHTFFLVALLLVERIAFGKENRWLSFLLGISLVFVIYIRLVGVVLVFSMLGYLMLVTGARFFRKLWPSLLGAVCILVVLVGLTPLQVHDLFPTQYLNINQAQLIAKLISVVKPQGKVQNQERPYGLSPGDDQEPVEPESSWGELINNYLILGVGQHLGLDIRSAISPIGGTVREREFTKQIGLPWLTDVIGFVFSAILIFGYFRWYKQERLTAFNFTSVIYFFSLFLWVWEGARFLYPILPQLFTGFLLGLYGLLEIVSGRLQRSNMDFARVINQWIPGAFLILYTALFIYKDVHLADSRQHVGVVSKRTAWIVDNTPDSSIIMSEYPVLDYLYSIRSTVNHPYVPITTSAICQYMHANKVDYALISPEIEWMLPSYIPNYSSDTEQLLAGIEELATRGNLELVYLSKPDLLQVYRVNRDHKCSETASASQDRSNQPSPPISDHMH